MVSLFYSLIRIYLLKIDTLSFNLFFLSFLYLDPENLDLES